MGTFPKLEGGGYLFGSPHKKGCSIWVSILGEARWYLAVGFRVGRLPFRWQGQGILQVQGLGEGGGGDNSDILG